MKDVTSCDNALGEVHVTFEPEISECDFAISPKGQSNAGDGNILVPAGKEINRDAASISERTQYKAN